MVDQSGQADVIGPRIDKESESRDGTAKERSSNAAARRITQQITSFKPFMRPHVSPEQVIKVIKFVKELLTNAKQEHAPSKRTI